MATIVFLDDVAPIKGHRRGLAFDISQAGYIVKRRPSPINHQTDLRMIYRRLLKDGNQFYWDLNIGQRNLWSTFAALSGITGPYGQGGHQAGCAAFFACALNSHFAGDGFPVAPGPPLPVVGVTFTNLIRIDKDTVRATFNPSPAGANNRLYLRQGLPGPGFRNWKHFDGYISEYTAVNPNSTIDFTTKFQHLNGWNSRYWCGTQNAFGGRAVETEFDI